MTHTVRFSAALILLACAACEYPVPPDQVDDPSLDAQLRQQFQQWGIIPIGPMPAPDTALVRLGQALFFDRELSGNRDMSCATCHDPSLAMTDGLSLGVGTGGTGTGLARVPGAGRQYLPRSAPTLINEGLRAYSVFWDGRISGFGTGPFTTDDTVFLPSGLNTIVAAQAMFPVLNRAEMRGTAGDIDVLGNPNELAPIADQQHGLIWNAVMNRLMAIPEYVTMFRAAFGSQPGFQFTHAATALAAFQTHELTRADSPFDRYLQRDNSAMTDEQKRGALLFFGGANCSQCHSGALLGGNGGVANVGVPQLGPGVGAEAPLDLGRGNHINQQFYRFAFRVPPLRNVELTAPYFHDGVYPTLEAVVNHYNDVNTAMQNFDVNQVAAPLRSMHHGTAAVLQDQQQNLDFRVRQLLRLTDAEKGQLVAFLKALTDPAARDMSAVAPSSVPSGLPVR